MKKLITFIFIALPILVFSQKGVEFVDGWIELKKGDTLKGKICYQNKITGERYDKIIFLDENGSKKRFGHERTTSIMADGKIYEFVPLMEGEMPFLMERVVSGDIYMYKAWFKLPEYTPAKPSYEEAVFLKKKSSNEYVEFFAKNFQKQMKSYFKGDEDIVQLVKEKNYDLKDLDKIVIAYNEKE